MRKYPFIFAAATLATLMAAQSSAYPVGALMKYTTSNVISGAVTGAGGGGGTGVFDSSGLLTIESFWDFNVSALGATATRFDTTLIEGIIDGSSWTGTGTGTAIVHSCVGSDVICNLNRVGVFPITPQVTALDIYTGGAWSYTNVLLNGALRVTFSDVLTPRNVPLPNTLWLFFAAALPALAGFSRNRGVT
jgi:hypothetical protein